ncbi:MAG: hypothetical protein H0U70_06820 [Tatlockia sp.]|nr:hypothetical protein [Tatlockia sp.]
MLKKTLAIIGLAANGLAIAGTMGPTCVPGDVSVPCAASKWNLGVQALYLQPTYSANKAYEPSVNNNVSDFSGLRPDWGWGYQIEGSYHYLTGSDLTMTLMHYDIDTERGFAYRGFTLFSTDTIPYNLHLENKFDQVNFVLGQQVDMGSWKTARFYGGLQYAKIRVDEANTYATVPQALVLQGVAGFQQYRDANVNGVGPVIGIDYSYNLPRGFSLTANTASSLLAGSTRYNDGYVFRPTGLVRFNNKHSRNIVVPSIEAKLGIKYVFECSQGALNVEGGYRALNYFNVFQTRSQAVLGAAHSTDFGLYGPYFGAKWVGNV